MPELSTYSGGKRVAPDGTVREEFRLARGWWEAKDTPDFAAFAKAGKELARLHVEYESLDPWPLQEIVDESPPFSERVTEDEAERG